MTAVAATPALYPTPRTPSSLAWEKLRNHSWVAAHPLRSGRKTIHLGNPAFGLWSFNIVSGCALMVGPHANSSKLSNIMITKIIIIITAHQFIFCLHHNLFYYFFSLYITTKKNLGVVLVYCSSHTSANL